MTNHEKFIEIFGDTGEDVKAAPSWLGKEYVGPVTRTEREKFLEWLEVQPFISYTDCHGVIIVKNDVTDTNIIGVSDFRDKPGFVYVNVDGLSGWKKISDVKEIIRKASQEQMDKHIDFFDGLYNEIFGR